MSNLGYKQSLLNKLQSISESAADEVYIRIETLPAKELVGLLSSSIQLQTILEREIVEAKREMDEGTDEQVVNVKYDSLGVDRSKVINLLDHIN